MIIVLIKAMHGCLNGTSVCLEKRAPHNKKGGPTMKKILSLVLALSLLLTCAVSVATAEETSVYPLDGTNEPLTLLMVADTNVPNAGYEGWGDTAFVKEWQKQTGINIEVKEAADNAALILNLSSGEYPDIVMMYENAYNGGLTSIIEDELAINLMDYAEYMPDYLNLVNGVEDYRRYVTNTDGGVYFFANFFDTDNGAVHWRGMVLRQDMLDQLQMDVPQTNEEFYNMLVAMRDQLGCDIPLAGNWWQSVLFDDGFASTEYGLVNASGYQKDGKYHYGSYEPEYRDYLAFVKKLYDEGLMDPNFQTTDEATSQASLLSGETGAHPTSCARINTISARATDENFKLVAVSSLDASDGTKAYFSQTDSLTPARVNAYITADCDQPELAVQLFNWLYTEYGTIVADFGPEGKCWEYNEEGVPTFTEYMTANESGLSLDQMLYVESMMNRPKVSTLAASEQRFPMEEQRAALSIWHETDSFTYLLPSYSISDAELSTEATSLWTDLSTYITESRVKFITGELNLEADFDAYLAQLKTMGMDRYIEIQQIALDEYYSK